MDLTRWMQSRSAGHIALYAALGAALGYLSLLFASASSDEEIIQTVFYYTLGPCLASIVILPSWGFRNGGTYWRAPLMCALALVSWTVVRYYLFELFYSGPSLAWSLFDLLSQGVVETFAMLGYIVRAVVIRSGRFAAAVLLMLGAATNLIYLPGNPLPMWIPGAAHVFQYACAFGLAAWAAAFLPRRTARRKIETVLVESR